jgi:bifunctional DNA-binding transcriptional regulator/antitoxin component of YhaV-PrlF toxin-antitoxin module
MSEPPQPVKFKAELVTSDGTPVYHFLRFQKEKVKHFGFRGNLRRVICTLNGVETFNCVLYPRGDSYSIALNKKLRDKLGISVGDTVEVYLERDESKYGYPVPKEFAEVLRQDAEGKAMFESLSPGNQRMMLMLIDKNKDVDKRITRSLVGLGMLKQNAGKFDYHAQDDAMRLAVSPRKSTELD